MGVMAALVVAWCCAAACALALGLRLPFPSLRNRRTTRRHDRRTLWLQQAGVRATPAQFVAVCIGAFIVAMAGFTSLAGPVVAFVPSVAIATLPFVYYGRRRTTRLAAAQVAWPDALRDIVTSIATGQSLHQALCAIAESHHDPLNTAFRRYPSLSRAIGTAAALEVVRAELADPVSDRVVEVLILASNRGGSVVRSIMEDLAASVTADQAVLNEIDTLVLESRINARAVVVMPWIALLLLNQGGGPFREFYESPAGAVVVAVGAGLTVIGWSIVSKLSRVPTEERVFGTGVQR